MENRKQFLRGFLNPFGKVLLIQTFQESEIVFETTVVINTTKERLEAARNELNRKILLGLPIVMTFRRVPKNIVTETTKVKARVVSEEAEGADSQEPRTRRDSRKPRETFSQEQSLQGEGLLGSCMGKTVPENPLFH